jgi:anaerobic ribonucleoside-triphosphate reductase activating protein
MYIGGTDYSLTQKAFEIYVAGCHPPHCTGCHNPELWDFTAGQPLSGKLIDQFIDKINTDLVENVWILGGEPLDAFLPALLQLVTILKFSTKDKKFWLFTRYGLKSIDRQVKEAFDYIKTGRYRKDEQSNHVEHGVTLATANQHIYERGVDY